MSSGSAVAASNGSVLHRVARALFIITALLQLAVGIFGPLESILHRSIALSVYLSLLFLDLYLSKPVRSPWHAAWTWLWIAVSVGIGIYMWSIYDQLHTRVGGIGGFDLVVAYVLVAAVLVAVKRTMGWPLVILALAFLLYTRYGPYFPGIFGHRGVGWQAIGETILFSQDGVYGFPIGMMSTYLFLYILFGAFFDKIGLTDLLVNLARYIAGRVVGGTALSAVISSALVGSISGSAVSNVMITGSFTLPMMKRAGYQPEFAAAVESAASTGGQILPPVMGVAAFVMAEVMGVPYVTVVKVALVPALLYFFGVGMSVYFASKRDGIGVEREGAGLSLWEILRSQGFLVLPLVALMVALFAGASLLRAGMIGIAACVVVGILNPHRRFGLREFLDTLEEGARMAVSMGAVLAWVGITIGLILSSGFGALVSGTLVRAVGDNLLLVLLVTMAASLILGMGMTTVAVYITLAIAVVPGLIEMGVNPYAAHFFAFYFGVLSFVTPPVCIATYAAAGLINANPTTAGWKGLQLTLSGFLVPFAAVYQPALLLLGSPGTSALIIALTAVGVIALTAGLQGYLLQALSSWERMVAGVAGVALIHPDYVTSMVGVALFVGLLLVQWRRTSVRPAGMAAVD